MLSKVKSFLSNPLYLLAAVVSVAMLTVGSVMAFNALAADSDSTLDSGGYYKPYTIDYMYYNHTETDVQVQTYYQEVMPVNEEWKVYSNGSSTYFNTVGADDSEEAFTPDANYTHLDLTLTAEAPDSSAPNWNETVWVYQTVWSTEDPVGNHYICRGTTTVGALVNALAESSNGSYTVYEGGRYTYASVDFSALTLDTTQADSNPNNLTFDAYCYAIGGDKPYTYDGNIVNGYKYSKPSAIGLSEAAALSIVDVFYAADPDIEYTADYNRIEDVPYGDKITLKKSTTDDFAFAQNVQMPICTQQNSYVLGARAVVYDMDGNELHTVKLSTSLAIDDSIDTYAFFNLYGSNYISQGNWLYQYVTSTSGTYAVNMPISVTIKYDYSRYKSADGSNINDPGALEGQELLVYKSGLDDVTYQDEYLNGATFDLADDPNAPQFKPQGVEQWCDTEFWREKDNVSSRLSKGTVNASSIAFPGVYGDALKELFTFNNETGFWERTVLIEPIFEDCYLNLTYHDSYWSETLWDEETGEEYSGYWDYFSATEVYVYVYKDSSNNLLDSPVAPSVKIKDPKYVRWGVNYEENFIYNHLGETFVDWNTEPNNTATSYDIGDTLTMNDHVDVYAQWNANIYHLKYEFHSPTGSYDDISFEGKENFPTNREVILSKDTTKENPPGGNIFHNRLSWYNASYNLYEYCYFDEDGWRTASSSLYLELKDGATVPSGTAFQYWSLTNNDGENEPCSDIYISDFEEGDDGEYYITVHAIWTQPSYTLIYEENKQAASDTVSGMPDPTSETIKYADLQSGYALSTAKPTYSGQALTFKGWGMTADSCETVTTINYSDFTDLTDGSEIRVYAIWDTAKTVTYHANVPADAVSQPTGTVPVDANSYPVGETVTVLGKGDLARDGYEFTGWNTASDGSGTSYAAGATFTIQADVNLYAQWEENTYTLVYKAGNGHDSAVIPADESELKYTEIKDGHALSDDTPTDTGYTFAGWQVNDVDSELNEGGTVPFDSFDNEDKTATATATWTTNSHNVTYWEADGITQIGTAQAYEYMSSVTVGANAGTPKTFDDKTWTGEWVIFDSASTDGDGQAISGAGTSFKMPDNDVKFKAVYEDNIYTVRYTAGYDGSGQADILAENLSHNDKHTIQENTFTRTGYDFSGWELVTPDDKDYPTAPVKGDEINVVSDVTYKATWTVKQFTVTYQDGYSDDTANDKLFTVNYNESHTVQEYSTFTRSGYTLTGWELVSPTAGYPATPGDQYNVVENVTYKAIWTPNTHWVKYEITIPSDISYTKPSDEQKTYGTSVDVQPNPTLTADEAKKYTFSGWSSTDVSIDGSGSFTMPDKDVTIRGSFTENGKVTLTYNANGATSGTAPDAVSDYTEVNETIKGQGDLLKTGYTFDGWNASPDGDSTIYTVGNSYTFTQNTTIYAKWTPNEYHVRYYDVNGNELTALAETHDYGTAFTVRTNADIPNVTGKETVGWKFKSGMSTDADGTAITGSGTYKMPEGDVEFIAEYNDISYTVTYQVSNAPSTYTVPTAQSYKYGDAVTVEAVPSIEGYNFAGWNCSQVDVSSGSFTMPAENVVITGVFTEKGKVTLTYNANGGTPETAVPASEWAYTELTATIKNHTGLSKTGYKFNGWNDKQDGTGNAYTIGNSYTFAADTVLYAQWAKESFNVEYYEADGTTIITTHTYEFRASVNVGNGVTPTVGEGQVWNGEWVLINNAQTDADNAEIGTRNNYPMPAETVKYKAVLTAKTYTVTYIMEGDQPSDLTYTPPVVATYSHGDTVNVVSVPTGYDTSAYTFTGWDYNESGTYYAGGTSKASFQITENVVLKGVWEKITPPDPDEVTITYTSGLTGDDVTDPSLNNTRTEQITIGSDYTVHDNDGWTNYVRPGYRFVSWKVAAPKVTGLSLLDNIVARFTGPATVGQTFVGGDTITSMDDSITLEAQWEEVKYSITYDANGATSGTVPTDNKEYSYNETATVKDNGDLAKSGAVFKNWNTHPNGNGTAYAPNAQITMTEDVTLYAIWEAEPSDDTYYTLKYDANGATSGSVPQDYTHYTGGESVTVADKGNLAKTNCTFKEWNTQANGKGTGYNANDVLTMPQSDVTLYAIWVDSDGNITSPGTGENALGIQIALGALIISVLSGGGVAVAMLKKRRYGESK